MNTRNNIKLLKKIRNGKLHHMLYRNRKDNRAQLYYMYYITSYMKTEWKPRNFSIKNVSARSEISDDTRKQQSKFKK